MVNWLWWVQVVAGSLTSLLTIGAIVTGLYTVVRGAPVFLRRLTGVNGLEGKMDKVDKKVDMVLTDVEKMQDLQYQQAGAYNDLKDTVCSELDIPPDERPDSLNTVKIRREVLDHDHTDFRRSASRRRPHRRDDDDDDDEHDWTG